MREGRHGINKCKVVCVMCDSNILSDTNKRLPVYLVKNNWRIPTNASCSDIPQMTRTRSRGDSEQRQRLCHIHMACCCLLVVVAWCLVLIVVRAQIATSRHKLFGCEF